MPNHEQPDGRGAIPGAREQVVRRESSPLPSRARLADRVQWMMLTVLILALAYLLWRGVHVLLLAFAGILFAIFLSALSGWLSQRTGLSYGKALAIVVVVLALMVGWLGWLLANHLAGQVAELSQKLPQSLQQIHDNLQEYPWGRLLLEKVPQAAETFARNGALSRVTGFFSGVANFLIDAVVILFVGIFGAAEPEVYKNGLLHLIPLRQRGRVTQALDAVVHNLRWWLVGQLLLMVLIGVTTSVGLWLLGIPLALTLGLIAGILELIPFIGPWLAVVPAALIALPLGPWYVVVTLALYLALHLLEGYVLMPLVQRRAVHLPPALTLVAQFLLGELLGVLGLFVAAPLTVTAIVCLKMLYVEDALGDETVQVPGGPGKTTPNVQGGSATAGQTSPSPTMGPR